MASVISRTVGFKTYSTLEAEVVTKLGEDWLISLTKITPRKKGEHKRTRNDYWVSYIPSDWGVAFELRRIEPDPTTGEAPVYHTVWANNPQDCHCNCHGFEAHGNCCHLEGLGGLIEQGQV